MRRNDVTQIVATTTRPLLFSGHPEVLRDLSRSWPTVGYPPNLSNCPILVNFRNRSCSGSPGAFTRLTRNLPLPTCSPIWIPAPLPVAPRCAP